MGVLRSGSLLSSNAGGEAIFRFAYVRPRAEQQHSDGKYGETTRPKSRSSLIQARGRERPDRSKDQTSSDVPRQLRNCLPKRILRCGCCGWEEENETQVRRVSRKRWAGSLRRRVVWVPQALRKIPRHVMRVFNFRALCAGKVHRPCTPPKNNNLRSPDLGFSSPSTSH